jgi:hypothetical protein
MNTMRIEESEKECQAIVDKFKEDQEIIVC